MATPERIRIYIAHLDQLTNAGLRYTLADQLEIEIVDAAMAATADVVVVDYESGLRWLETSHSDAAMRNSGNGGVFIITPRDSEAEIRHAMEAGARGYLQAACTSDEILEGIRAIYRGLSYLGKIPAHRIAESFTHTPLTGRELQVLRLMATGKANKVIARQLGIALGTVKAHSKAILAKLDVKSRTEATFVAEHRGLLSHLPLRVVDAPSTTSPPPRWAPPARPAKSPQLHVA